MEPTGFGQGRARGERLVALCAALVLGRPVTLQELRSRFGLYETGDVDASRRRFERDKEDLRALGVHLREVRVGDGHGYRIDRRGTVDVAWSDEEAIALATLAAVVDDPVTGAALAKVTATTPDYPAPTAPARIRIDVTVAPRLAEAAFESRRVAFTYRNARGEVATRTVEPWALATRRGLTYVTGWDLDRQAARVYRADRVRGTVRDLGGATVDRPPPGDLGVPLRPDDRREVVMRVSPRLAGDAAAMGATVSDPAPPAPDHVTATFAALQEETAIGWALRHRADVVAPDDIAAEVDRRRARVADHHRGDPDLGPLPAGTVRRARRAGLSDERLARLLALPRWLEGRDGVTLDEVAQAFGCTVGEVVAELSLLDVVEVPGVGNVAEADVDGSGQVTFRPLVDTPSAALTVPEVLHLLTLTDVAAAVLPTAQAATIDGITKRLRDALPAAASGIEVEAVDRPGVAALRRAVADELPVRFTYRGRRDDAVSTRRVLPTELSMSDRALYVVGHDLAADAPRVFRLDRVGDVEVEEDGRDAADAPRPDSIAPAYSPVDDEVDAELRLTTRGTWILALVAPSQVRELADGEVHARVRTDAPTWLADHVRAAGGEAELLRPAELRAALAAT